jgi:hypothetical protein
MSGSLSNTADDTSLIQTISCIKKVMEGAIKTCRDQTISTGRRGKGQDGLREGARRKAGKEDGEGHERKRAAGP